MEKILVANLLREIAPIVAEYHVKELPLADFDPEPFEYLRRDRGYDVDVQTVFGNRVQLSEEEFPENIARVFYFENGQHDGDPWVLVCQLTNGAFAYFRAWCDYTGFDCRGGMLLRLSSNLQHLVVYGLEKDVRNNYIDFQNT